MSQPAFSALAPLPFDLVYDDGEPLESGWHVFQMYLLLDLIPKAMAEQGRSDFYVGGNSFVYYSIEQARDVASSRPYFRGPDVFWVDGVAPTPIRKAWVAWEEGGRLPDVIFELLSSSTAHIDRNEKKVLYAEAFRTSEYFLYDPETLKLEGYRLMGSVYRPMIPNSQGRFWSQQLGVFVGPWHGIRDRHEADWVRLFRPDGTLVPTPGEQVEAERQRAEAERQRAEEAEAEVARLRALLEGGQRTGSD
ncbi:MAG TPA: Uma2 family endonuclease [Thermoanaerobaculia bacterium]|jgi:Uma2 family endonuclease|nr:Uma2 family endonuclease [Thermoanaerobaculia bacterium]